MERKRFDKKVPRAWVKGRWRMAESRAAEKQTFSRRGDRPTDIAWISLAADT